MTGFPWIEIKRAVYESTFFVGGGVGKMRN